jgi:NitT/TauT family transport system substrate-binding protein
VCGAWEYIANGHEDEGVQAIIAQRPNAKLDPKVLRGQIDALKGYFGTAASKGMPAGMMADADWVEGVKTMASVKLIKDAKASEFYTNELLDPALIRKTSGR